MCFHKGTACHRHPGDSQVRGHLDDEEAGAHIIWRKAERAGTAQHRAVSGEISSLCTNM